MSGRADGNHIMTTQTILASEWRAGISWWRRGEEGRESSRDAEDKHSRVNGRTAAVGAMGRGGSDSRYIIRG